MKRKSKQEQAAGAASSQIILISGKSSEVEKAESFACKNSCVFSVYTPEEWGSRSDEAFLFHNEESSQKAIPLPSGKRPVFSLEEIEAYVIEKALTACHGSAARAARLLRIGRATLYRKMERSGLHIERFRQMEAEAEAARKAAKRKGKIISLKEERKKRKGGASLSKTRRPQTRRPQTRRPQTRKTQARRRQTGGPQVRRPPAGKMKAGKKSAVRLSSGTGRKKTLPIRSLKGKSLRGKPLQQGKSLQGKPLKKAA